MSEGLRAEDVKEALGHYDEWGTGVDHLGRYEQVKPLVAAARAWLASQEQTPDIEWTICVEHGSRRWEDSAICEALAGALRSASECRFAALVGFHPQPKGDD